MGGKLPVTKKSIITSAQLFVSLFVSRMIVNITYNVYLTPNGEIQDYILSESASFLLTFIFVIPVYLLYKKDKTLNILDRSENIFGGAGKIITVFYVLYFIGSCIYNFSFYNNFVSNVMAPKISIVMVNIAIVITVCYGAIKGIEGLVRVSGIIFVLTIAGIIFLICATIPQVEEYNFVPFLYNGTEDFIIGLKLMTMHSSCIVIMAFLLPLVKGNVRRSIILWNVGVYVVIVSLMVVMVGSLGDFIKTQTFPIYVLSSMAQMGIIKRMNSIYIAIWTSGLFVKLSLYLYCFSICIKRIFGEKSGKISIIIGGALSSVLSIIVVENESLSFFSNRLNYMLGITIVAAVLIPVIILLTDILKVKRGENNEN